MSSPELTAPGAAGAVLIEAGLIWSATHVTPPLLIPDRALAGQRITIEPGGRMEHRATRDAQPLLPAVEPPNAAFGQPTPSGIQHPCTPGRRPTGRARIALTGRAALDRVLRARCGVIWTSSSGAY
jgi:hypothetical protein